MRDRSSTLRRSTKLTIMEERACKMLLNLLLQSSILSQEEEEKATIELERLAKDPKHREYCRFRGFIAQAFLRKEEIHLHSVLYDLFVWERTFDGDEFWKTIADKFAETFGGKEEEDIDWEEKERLEF